MNDNSSPYQNYIAYYINVANTKEAIPAIFERKGKNSKLARLFLIKAQQQGATNGIAAIEKAQRDLTAALKSIMPIAKFVAGSGILRAALFKQGYTWPTIEIVEIEIPPDETLLKPNTKS